MNSGGIGSEAAVADGFTSLIDGGRRDPFGYAIVGESDVPVVGVDVAVVVRADQDYVFQIGGSPFAPSAASVMSNAP